MNSVSLQPPKLERDHPLARHTSVRVGGPADLFTIARGSRDLEHAARWAMGEGLNFMVLGSGSNVVVADAGFRGLIIKTLSRDVQVVGEDERGAVVELDCGTFLPTAAKRLGAQGLAGLEWGVGIPGTAGGAVVGNAGAYGGVTSETLLEVDGLAPNGEPMTVTSQDLRFEYRSSSLKRGEIRMPVILRVRHLLPRGEAGDITVRIEGFLGERKRKQPVEPSVGSTFKNPACAHAGVLIEQLGLKGTSVGGAMISAKHANYIINRGNATASDVRALVERVREAVYARSGVLLETEIEFKGAW